MSELIHTTTYPNGLVLNRRYESTRGTVDEQCGSMAYWNPYLGQLFNSASYYTKPDGKNKFFEKIELNVYSKHLPFPDANLGFALTYSYPNGRSKINMPYDTGWDPYVIPASLSHEFGHAYHNWCGLYGADQNGLREVSIMWEKLISTNHTACDPNSYPWKRTDGGTENPFEQFANSYRCLFGTSNTKGVSGPNTRELVVPGFENTNDHPDWETMIRYLPELCSFVRAYGCKPNTLEWKGWHFYLQINTGHWVYMDYYFTINDRQDGWHYWDGFKWIRWAPSYTRT